MVERRPTTWSTATSLARRQQIIALHQAQCTYAEIAERVGCSRWTVGRWVRAWQRDGPSRLEPRSHRPHQLHPQTTPIRIQARIRAIREQHPGWGPRLIHRTLEVERVTPLPSERTIQAWLHRQGFPLVRPRTAKPLGFPASATPPHQPLWEADFKQKGGSPI
jgi:transposase